MQYRGQQTITECLKCPFDQTHLMPRDTFIRHIRSCRAKNKDQFKECPYDVFHYVRRQNFDNHIRSCPSKKQYDEIESGNWDDWSQQNSLQESSIISTNQKYKENVLTASIVKSMRKKEVQTDQKKVIQNFQKMKIQDKGQDQSFWGIQTIKQSQNKVKSSKLADTQKIDKLKNKQENKKQSNINENVKKQKVEIPSQKFLVNSLKRNFEETYKRNQNYVQVDNYKKKFDQSMQSSSGVSLISSSFNSKDFKNPYLNQSLPEFHSQRYTPNFVSNRNQLNYVENMRFYLYNQNYQLPDTHNQYKKCLRENKYAFPQPKMNNINSNYNQFQPIKGTISNYTQLTYNLKREEDQCLGNMKDQKRKKTTKQDKQSNDDSTCKKQKKQKKQKKEKKQKKKKKQKKNKTKGQQLMSLD